MFLQDKVNDINTQFKLLDNVLNVVIWGAGVHTGKLLEKTDLLFYNIKSIVDMDEMKWGEHYFGFVIQKPEDIIWREVGAVVVSVRNKEQQIAETLVNEFRFQGKIITLYRDNEYMSFYQLPDKKRPGIYLVGDYENWNDAYKECEGGYAGKNILEQVISATKKVLDGEAVWERDGYLFYEQKYVYRICAAILRCAIQNNNKGVRILDVGGSLGSTYLQNRAYLADVKNLEYVIAEQDNFADYGHQNREDGVLKFIRSTDDYKKYGRFDIILLSGSLQCIENYQEIISKIIETRARYIIIDRIMVGDRTRIFKEIVPEEIWEGSVPVRSFCEKDINNFFAPNYVLVEKDIASTPGEIFFIDGKISFLYFVFQNISERKNS